MTDPAINELRAKIERRRRNERRLFGLACLVTAAVPVGLILSASVTQPPAIPAPVEEAKPANRLVGLGCGPKRLTLAAVEEDELPAPCDTIDTPENVCGLKVTADECAAYMGNGW